MQNIRKYLLPSLLILAVLLSILKPTTGSLQSAGEKLQSELIAQEQFFTDNYKSLLSAMQSADPKNETLKACSERTLYVFCYKADSLVSWTTNLAYPSVSPSVTENGTTFIRLKNGWFQMIKQSDGKGLYSLIALTPVKYEYPFENRFLTNTFNPLLHTPGNLAVSPQQMEGAFAVKTINGEPLFSLYLSGNESGYEVDYLLLFAQLIILVLLFYYIGLIASRVATGKGLLTGMSLLVLSLVLVRFIMLYFDVPKELSRLQLFDPKFYASSPVTKSLGDLLIDTLLLSWVVYFYFSRRQMPSGKTDKWKAMVGVFVLFGYTGSLLWVFKTLVMDSVISFEIYNILSLGFYSFLGLLCMAFLMGIHFMLLREVTIRLQSSGFSIAYVLISVLAAGVLFVAVGLNTPFYESVVYTALWICMVTLLFFVFFKKDASFSFRNLMLWVSLYSILSTLLIENLYERRERNGREFFSGKLVAERDYVAEYMFADIEKQITSDGFIANSFDNPFVSATQIADRINTLYLSGYFNKYDISVFAFDQQGNSIKGSDTTHLNHFLLIYNKDSSQGNTFHYIADSILTYSYLSVIPFTHDSIVRGSIVLKFSPKVYYGQNVYPELLLGSNLSLSFSNASYAYAIYQNKRLIAQYGDYPYTYYWNKDYKFGDKDFVFIEEKDWEHSIQRFYNGKEVVVSVPREPLFEPIATFSYFFSFFVLVITLVFALIRATGGLNTSVLFIEDLTVSFRTRINFSMLIMILISFVIIGFVTISFFSRQYDNFYTDRLLRKEKVIHATLEYFVQKNIGNRTLDKVGSDNDLQLEIARLADINAIDINLFDTQGDLMISSQPTVYTKGLLSRKINPEAYYQLSDRKEAQVIEQEQIGKLNYLATYTPLRNSNGNAIAFLGIPYFERSKNINDEVSSFLVSLMNVYVFLMICAALLAFFVSNSITRPLTIISEKLRFLNLNKKNEPIQWNSRDEIGVLVSEYNKMISELEQSAQKLAKGERESAWREMAKQIAHEIKNPLTPMKLSIQYLRRAIDEGQPNIEVLAKKVTGTLEEQIENLSSIATAFSSFAKMPKPENELLSINDLLRSIADLFNRDQQVSISFNSDVEQTMVFADKNQLVSVFNNLVKNAVQSIPENRKGFVDINLKEEGDRVIVSVSDNGSGIPADNYDKVFVPNFTTKSSGTGLGLAITKRIIEGAGGDIWFESAENVGTTFYVKLQKARA